jgi:predicted dehydrogenase
MVAAGDLGRIRLVQVEYAQDWLTEAVEATGSKQAEWRTDPARSGAGGALGDIGTHAYNLAAFVSGEVPQTLAADLSSFVPGRKLDDNAHVMLRYASGARGTLWCSQVAPGNENGLRLRVYGEKGGLDWGQEDPNRLWFTPFGQEKRLITRNGAGAGPAAQRVSRVPGGHPEGYLEAFATIYAEAARSIRAHDAGQPVPEGVTYPTLTDGLQGMRFVEAAVQSAKRNAAWVTL